MSIDVQMEHALIEIGISNATSYETVRTDPMKLIVLVTHHTIINARMAIALKHGNDVMEMRIVMTIQMNWGVHRVVDSNVKSLASA